jgi:phosphatidylglycerophosphatase A
MRSYLKDREIVLKEFYEEFFSYYSRESILSSTKKLLKDVVNIDLDANKLEDALDGVLSKTETFNTLLTLLELEKRCSFDEELKKSMKDPSYNQHRTIAINICDMYSSGATSFFGYMDCMFRSFFPQKHPKSFLSKGVCAIIASAAENLELLASRNVSLEPMVQMVYDLQVPYNPDLTLDECKRHLLGVLRKQQTFHAIDLCVRIDKGVENKEFGAQFQEIVANDEGLYGLDETVNTSISKMYGMIAITNFGYLDKEKPGIIGELDSDHENGHCNTYIDDTVCAIVSAACARLAHNNANTKSKPKK